MNFRNLSRRLSFLIIISIASVALTSCAHATDETTPVPGLAIEHVGLVDIEEGVIRDDQTVVITDGVIIYTGPSSSEISPRVTESIDASGLYLIPGLWDMHAHMRAPGVPAFVTTDWMMPLLLANGVTGVRDMSSDCDGDAPGAVCLDQMKEWKRQVAEGDLLGPRFVALSSFQVNPPWDYEVTEEQARGLVRMYEQKGVDNIKIYHRLSRDAFGWMLDEAEKLGIDAGGHVPIRVSTAEASEAGMRSIEHARDLLFDCFPGAADFRRTAESQDAPIGLMRAMVDDHDAELCESIFASLVSNGTHYVPTHVTRKMEAFAGDAEFRRDPRSKYVPDVIMKSWISDADRVVARDPSPEGRKAYMDFYLKGLELTGAAHRAGVPILVGTDGGDSFVFPGTSIHDEMEELIRAGLSTADTLRAATLNGAAYLGRAEEFGTIDEGKRADLVLLAGNPLEDIANVRRIRGVVFRGELLDRDDLDTLLKRAEDTVARIGAGSPE